MFASIDITIVITGLVFVTSLVTLIILLIIRASKKNASLNMPQQQDTAYAMQQPQQNFAQATIPNQQQMVDNDQFIDPQISNMAFNPNMQQQPVQIPQINDDPNLQQIDFGISAPQNTMQQTPDTTYTQTQTSAPEFQNQNMDSQFQQNIPNSAIDQPQQQNQSFIDPVQQQPPPIEQVGAQPVAQNTMMSESRTMPQPNSQDVQMPPQSTQNFDPILQDNSMNPQPQTQSPTDDNQTLSQSPQINAQPTITDDTTTNSSSNNPLQSMQTPSDMSINQNPQPIIQTNTTSDTTLNQAINPTQAVPSIETQMQEPQNPIQNQSNATIPPAFDTTVEPQNFGTIMPETLQTNKNLQNDPVNAVVQTPQFDINNPPIPTQPAPGQTENQNTQATEENDFGLPPIE
jgi:hypothetical protein